MSNSTWWRGALVAMAVCVSFGCRAPTRATSPAHTVQSEEPAAEAQQNARRYLERTDHGTCDDGREWRASQMISTSTGMVEVIYGVDCTGREYVRIPCDSASGKPGN